MTAETTTSSKKIIMRLTTKSRYGTRLILDLALYGKEEPVRLILSPTRSQAFFRLSSIDLITQLNRKARELRLKSAPLYAFSQWTCPPGTAAELYEHLSAQQQESLQNPALRSAGIGVIRQGDLTVIVQVYIEHY